MGPSLSPHRARRFLFAVISLFCFAYGGFSQQRPGKGGSEIREIDGFVVRVVRLHGGAYGYEILKGPEILVHQRRNPFTGREGGLKEKEDAMKIATWMVKTVLKKEHMLPRSKRLPEGVISNRPIPAAVARQLQITVE